MKKLIKKIVEFVTHIVGRFTRNYYFEDYVRVYPDGLAFDRLGRKRNATIVDINNFLNHCKFYQFASQFVGGKSIADVGCGSGYGSKILFESRAADVEGFDISKSSISFARKNFARYGRFRVASITDLSMVPDSAFDVTICSEVLEHVKEYKMERKATEELRRITRPGGLIIVGTPNSELLENHGFSYAEITRLFGSVFSRFVVFENAFVPSGGNRELWNKRLHDGETGIIVSESINFRESAIPSEEKPETKQGLAPGQFEFGDLVIDTGLLHNTHSWAILALNDK